MAGPFCGSDKNFVPGRYLVREDGSDHHDVADASGDGGDTYNDEVRDGDSRLPLYEVRPDEPRVVRRTQPSAHVLDVHFRCPARFRSRWRSLVKVTELTQKVTQKVTILILKF